MLTTWSKNHYTFKLDNNPFIYLEEPLVFLATQSYTTNVGDLDQFIGSLHFDVEEAEIYAREIQGPNAIKWAKTMKKKWD